MDRRIVTAAQMKEIERAANERGIPYLQMMENAGLLPTRSCGHDSRKRHHCLLFAVRETTAVTALCLPARLP